MTKVEEAITEIRAALAEMEPIHEGLRDFARLNIHEDTRADVDAAIRQYDTRKAFLEAALLHAENLVIDCYPALDIPDVTLSVLADLEENKRTIDAAIAEFHSNAAGNLGLSAGFPEQK